MNKNHKKAVGYIRVSTTMQVKEGESLSTQRQQIEDFAKDKGWELVCIYADEGISGAKIEYRPDFKRLISDANQGKFEVVIFTKLSRFARNAREYMNLSHEMEKNGITLVSLKENIDPTTTTGRMIAGFLALLAEWERDTIKEQMHENKMARWKEQRTFIGKPPFGYYWNKEKKQLEINEDEAKVYNLLVDMYLNQKMSFQDMCIRLKKNGIKCKRANWSSTTISYILKNPAYYGNYIVNQYVYEDGGRGAGSKRSKKKKPNSEYIAYQIPPLIPKNQWNKIQEQTEFNKRKSKRSDKTDDLILRDVLICGRCGGRIKPRVGNIRRDGTAPRYYGCYWAGTSKKNLIASGRKKKCSLPYIYTKNIENAVWSDILMKFSLNPSKILEHLLNSKKHEDKINQLKETIARLESEFNKKERARNNLFKLTEEDEINIGELNDRLRINKDEILALKGSLDDTKLEYQELVSLNEGEKDILNFLHNNRNLKSKIRKAIFNLNLKDRKLLVESMLMDKVIVDYQEDNELDGPGGPTCDYKLKWNPDILQRFIEEGKITKLDKNSTYDPPRHELRGGA
ncbi:MAG: recombinase family protein [Thermodesulfobacteriota bacterium]